MNKSAFTLIELMGVIVVLSILVMISVPVVDRYIKQTKSESAEVQKESLILAARNWASDNKGSIPVSGSSINVTVDTLIELGYLDFDVYENLSNFEIDGNLLSDYDSIKITYDGKSYDYELILDESIDNTAPTNLDLRLVSSTVNTLTVRAFAEDKESIITTYDFNIDNERNADGSLMWQGSTGAKVYTFKNLTEGEHTIMFRATNAKGLSAESKKYTFNTRTVTRIEFAVIDEPNDCDSSREVRIIYPATATTRQYSTQLSGGFTTVTSPSITIEVDNTGTPITATAQVENVEVLSTYTVHFKKTEIDASGNEYTCICQPDQSTCVKEGE